MSTLDLYPVSKIEGPKGLRALNVYTTALMGLKMIPEYMGEAWESFLERFGALSTEEKVRALTQAVSIIEFKQDELEAIICFCKDKNGVPFDSTNIKNLDPRDMVKVIVSVALEVSKFKIDLVTAEEKKN